jgi:hypothetical protein
MNQAIHDLQVGVMDDAWIVHSLALMVENVWVFFDRKDAFQVDISGMHAAKIVKAYF